MMNHPNPPHKCATSNKNSWSHTIMRQRHARSQAPPMFVCNYVDENGSAAMPATKLSASVTQKGESGDSIACKWQSSQARGSTPALKPRADVTRSPKQGYQWPHNRTDIVQKFDNKKDIGELLYGLNPCHEVISNSVINWELIMKLLDLHIYIVRIVLAMNLNTQCIIGMIESAM